VEWVNLEKRIVDEFESDWNNVFYVLLGNILANQGGCFFFIYISGPRGQATGRRGLGMRLTAHQTPVA